MNTPMSKQELGHTETPEDMYVMVPVVELEKRFAQMPVDTAKYFKALLHAAPKYTIDEMVNANSLLSQVRQKDEALRAAHKPLLECFGDYSNPRFTDRYHAADRIKAALEAVEAALSPAPQHDADADPVLTGELRVGAVRFHQGIKISTAQAAIDRALLRSPQPDAAPADATAWLIEFSEKVSRTPAYYGHTGEGLGETTDSLKAVRFARREDAQAFIDDIGWNEARPVEHMWADSKCCNDFSPEECAQVPDRHCDGLQPASLLPADVAGMRAFGASEAACYHWPEDTELHRACREAYCRGAADCPPTDAAVKALERIAAVELGEQKETEAHWPARLMQSIAREALAANGVK